MHCPDCGHLLTPVPLGAHGEANQSFRCYYCGGFWVESWLANRLNSKVLDRWPQQMANRGGSGNMECPVHAGTQLNRFQGDSVPMDLKVYRCSICHWWWFPQNTLFRFKPAQEAKVNYYKAWGMPADLKGLMLPILVLIVLVFGGGVALQLIKQQQYALLQASGAVTGFTTVRTDPDQVLVIFKSTVPISQVDYRPVGSRTWTEIPISSETQMYQIRLSNLEPGEYEVKILGKIYSFRSQ